MHNNLSFDVSIHTTGVSDHNFSLVGDLRTMYYNVYLIVVALL